MNFTTGRYPVAAEIGGRKAGRHTLFVSIFAPRKPTGRFEEHLRPISAGHDLAERPRTMRCTFSSAAILRLGTVVLWSSGVTPARARDPELAFGIDKRVYRHELQLVLANTHATSLGQLARGGSSDSLYPGFNLARKFF